MKIIVKLAQRLGETLKQLGYKLQSLRLAHLVAGGQSSTEWIVPRGTLFPINDLLNNITY